MAVLLGCIFSRTIFAFSLSFFIVISSCYFLRLCRQLSGLAGENPWPSLPEFVLDDVDMVDYDLHFATQFADLFLLCLGGHVLLQW